jgi:hypothetical protein
VRAFAINSWTSLSAATARSGLLMTVSSKERKVVADLALSKVDAVPGNTQDAAQAELT